MQFYMQSLNMVCYGPSLCFLLGTSLPKHEAKQIRTQSFRNVYQTVLEGCKRKQAGL